MIDRDRKNYTDIYIYHRSFLFSNRSDSSNCAIKPVERGTSCYYSVVNKLSLCKVAELERVGDRNGAILAKFWHVDIN